MIAKTRVSAGPGPAGRSTARARRAPPSERSAERYRALARDTRRRRIRNRPLLVTILAWPVMVALGFVVVAQTVQTIGGSAGTLQADLEAALAQAFPALTPQKLDVVGGVGTVVEPDPLVDPLPPFTNATTLLLQGRVPALALAEDQRIEITLNGQVLTVPLDEAGRFASQLALRDGSNDIVTTLLRGAEAISATTSTVFVDKTAPPLSLVRPVTATEIEGPTIVVEGKSEPGAKVLVNERQVIASADGSFSEAFTAAAGPLTINVVARDQAGNETKTTLEVAVKDKAAVAGSVIAVSLDRSKVRPGEPVVADIVVVEDGRPRANLSVTLSVGVITIGTTRTNSQGNAKIGFAAPTTEGDIAVVVLGGDAAGRATLTVEQDKPATP